MKLLNRDISVKWSKWDMCYNQIGKIAEVSKQRANHFSNLINVPVINVIVYNKWRWKWYHKFCFLTLQCHVNYVIIHYAKMWLVVSLCDIAHSNYWNNNKNKRLQSKISYHSIECIMKKIFVNQVCSQYYIMYGFVNYIVYIWFEIMGHCYHILLLNILDHNSLLFLMTYGQHRDLP